MGPKKLPWLLGSGKQGCNEAAGQGADIAAEENVFVKGVQGACRSSRKASP